MVRLELGEDLEREAADEVLATDGAWCFRSISPVVASAAAPARGSPGVLLVRFPLSSPDLRPTH